MGLYAYCVFTNTAEGATGRPIYDVFMGVSLNPRIGRLDLKMWSELRVPWILLFVLTASCAAREAERFGRVSAPLAFMARSARVEGIRGSRRLFDFPGGRRAAADGPPGRGDDADGPRRRIAATAGPRGAGSRRRRRGSSVERPEIARGAATFPP